MPVPLHHVWLISVAVDLARYFGVAGGAFLVFWVLGRERFRHRLIPAKYAGAAKMLHDLRWSMSTIVVFSLSGVWLWYGGHVGIFRRYETIAEYGWPWFFASIVVLIVLQDTYFYWTHRAMHHPRLYRLVHRVHHESMNPSPWTAYAFSPFEAFTHAFYVQLAWLIFPLHEAAVFVFMIFMITRNVLGHLSLELFPRGFMKSALRFSTTATHHGMHHQAFRSNFGLYFTFWDRVMKTEHPGYAELFDEITAREAPSCYRSPPLWDERRGTQRAE